MEVLIAQTPWLIAMAGLIACSAFFSASETALFSLRERDRRLLSQGGPPQRAAAWLLESPELLLSTVLFWNLMTNMAYFAVASIVGFRLRQDGSANAAYAFSVGALVTIIFCSEMLPKSLGAVSAPRLSALVSLPLTAAFKLTRPLMPALQTVNLLSRRVIWPRFVPESYLEVSDLEEAIELTTRDAQLAEQEQKVLHNIVRLTEINIGEWMQPRPQLQVFRPPVTLRQVIGKARPHHRYLLISEMDSDEIAAVVDLQGLPDLPEDELDAAAVPIRYLPWCTSVADALEEMIRFDCGVIAVVGERGDTIGIVTFDDILDVLLLDNPSRSQRLAARPAIESVGDRVWRVSGITSLNRLSTQLGIQLPDSRSITLAGAIQQRLQKLLAQGDRGSWGRFDFHVLEAGDATHTVIELKLVRDESEEEQE